MDADELNPLPPRNTFQSPQWTLVESIPEFVIDYPPPPPPVRRVWLPVVLFLTTCLTTFLAGTGLCQVFIGGQLPEASWLTIKDGLMYSGAVMAILLCHEMGHFVQAVRYGVYASLPYFIPFPLSPIGTFGAVIRMEPRSRRPQGHLRHRHQRSVGRAGADIALSLVRDFDGASYDVATPNDVVYGRPCW